MRTESDKYDEDDDEGVNSTDEDWREDVVGQRGVRR